MGSADRQSAREYCVEFTRQHFQRIRQGSHAFAQKFLGTPIELRELQFDDLFNAFATCNASDRTSGPMPSPGMTAIRFICS